jgi:hypothetical protein
MCKDKKKSFHFHQISSLLILLVVFQLTPAGNVEASLLNNTSLVVNDRHQGMGAPPLLEPSGLPFSSDFSNTIKGTNLLLAAEDKIQPSLEPKPAPTGPLQPEELTKPQKPQTGQISPPAPRPAPRARQMERMGSPEMMEKSSKSAPMSEPAARSSLDRFGGTVIRGKPEPKD